MKTLLQLNTSLFAAGGQSSQLADKFVATWKANNDGANVIVRDLASNPLPHLDAEHFSPTSPNRPIVPHASRNWRRLPTR